MNNELVKLVPTWHNLRTRKHGVSKMLDRFISLEYLFSFVLLVKSSVDEGGHLVLKINLEFDSLPSPFKFNHIWIEEEYFVSMVKKYWKPLDSSRDHSMMF
jgi:hypothetical protein